jgi:hypothetical protein
MGEELPVPNKESFLESFGKNQIRSLGRLLEVARDLTGDFFELGNEEAKRVPYEVRTLTDLKKEEIHQKGVLADIARYEYREPHYGRKKDLYSVNLQDHNILNSLKNKFGDVGFSPLLLYILTHELIHVIRFVKWMVPFYLDPTDRTREEQRVHELTQRLLERAPFPGMEKVIRRYERILWENIKETK